MRGDVEGAPECPVYVDSGRGHTEQYLSTEHVGGHKKPGVGGCKDGAQQGTRGPEGYRSEVVV